MTVRPTHDPDEIAAALELRVQVFCDEQGVAPEEELDGLDHDCTQIVVLEKQDVVATCRLRLVDGNAKLERMAVDARHRGSGVGMQLIECAEREARASGAPQMVLHSQRAAEGFYAKAGYEVEGDSFMEAEIEHVRMSKDLTAADPTV